jgi:hypothetical protein
VTFLCKSHIFIQIVTKVIISEVKGRVLKRGDERPESGGK